MDAAYSLGGESNLLSGMMREVQAAASDEWTTIIDPHHY
jgi:hypothetical protein